jgi:hypothetical protein
MTQLQITRHTQALPTGFLDVRTETKLNYFEALVDDHIRRLPTTLQTSATIKCSAEMAAERFTFSGVKDLSDIGLDGHWLTVAKCSNEYYHTVYCLKV